MFGKIKDMFGDNAEKLKDAAISTAMELALKSLLSKYGDVQNVQIQTAYNSPRKTNNFLENFILSE